MFWNISNPENLNISKPSKCLLKGTYNGVHLAGLEPASLSATPVGVVAYTIPPQMQGDLNPRVGKRAMLINRASNLDPLSSEGLHSTESTVSSNESTNRVALVGLEPTNSRV